MVFLLASVLLVLSDSPPAQRVAYVQLPKSDQSSGGVVFNDSLQAGRCRSGMRVTIAAIGTIEKAARVISAGFTCATDPAFDDTGARLLFAGQKDTGDRVQVWEWSDGENEVRLIEGADGDAMQPAYLPNQQIVFASTAPREYEEHGQRPSMSLFAAGPGGDAARLTFNPSSDFDPTVLADGRILYSSWQHVGNHHWPSGVVSLMLINADGTGVFPLTGNHRGPWLKRGAKAWTGDRIVFIQSEHFDSFGAGALMMTHLNDPFAPCETLVPASRFLVQGAAALPDGSVLLSAKPADGSRDTFGLYRYRDGQVVLLYDDPSCHELAPAAPTIHAEPRISTVAPDTPYGYLAVLDCYETDRVDQRPPRPGTVRAVRVIEGLPLRRESAAGPTFLASPYDAAEPCVNPASATGYIPSRILGEVSPASDGSVYLKVPADRPLRLQLIDKDGFAVMNGRAWFWVRPNERRVCIGCHENRELSPRNAVPQAVRREVTDLTDPAGWRTVSFRRDIQPILTQNCALANCHVPPNPTAGLNMSTDRLDTDHDAPNADRFGPAYANLLARQENKPIAIGGRRVHPGDARSSPLLWMLYGRALAPQYAPAPFDRPMVAAHPGPMLPEAKLELLRTWVDLGAVYDETAPAGPWPYSFSPNGVVVDKRTSDDR